jgi:hypothetical protein
VPRDLGDVADYFLPSSPSGRREEPEPPAAPRPPASFGPHGAPQRPAALPILSIPIGDRDVVRAAFAWNLVVEIARLGGHATLLAPRESETSPLWPEPGPGPVGAEVVLSDAASLAELNRAALDVAVSRAADTPDGGVVVVRVPPSWLGHGARDGRALLRWVLLFSSPEQNDLMEAYGLAKRVVAASESARVGVTIHGARRVGEARQAFERVAGAMARHLRHDLVSYSLLVDDLHVYRAIVSRRPIGIEHPQSRAALALRDVAQLVLEDARKLAIA